METVENYASALEDYVALRSPEHLPLIKEAIALATYCHAGQKRRTQDGDEQPYILHPLRVALKLTRYQCVNMQTIAAAILHDTIEDAPERVIKYVAPDYSIINPNDAGSVRRQALRACSSMFGETVTGTIKRVTNPLPEGNQSKEQKRDAYVNHVEESVTTVSSLLVKISDMEDNGFKLHATSNPSRRGMVKHLAAKYAPVAGILLKRAHARQDKLGLPLQEVSVLLEDIKSGRDNLCKLSKTIPD